MLGPNMTTEKYAAMSKWQRIVYWVAVVLAAAVILYFWLLH